MFNVYDIETYEKENKVIPYCVCFILLNKKFVIYSGDCDDLILKSIELISLNAEESYIEIFVHNLNFDGILIINCLSLHKIKYNILSNKTNIYFLEIFYLNKKIKFRCSYKILPLSLKKIGLIENYPKLEFPYKFVNNLSIQYYGDVPGIEYWDNPNSYYEYTSLNKIFDMKKETIKYCLNDLFLTQKFLNNISHIIDNELKNVISRCYSTASITHKIFFKKYNYKKIKEKIYKKDEDYIRKSYFGGRCEVFGNINTNEHIKYFDFTGMYSQCMLENFHNGEGVYQSNSDYNLPGFHTIQFISNSSYLPVLPRHSEKGKLLFANGRGEGTFWFEEIQYFVEMGGVVEKVLNSYVYPKFEKVFDVFVDNFNKIKEKKGYYTFFGKLATNSLYGGMALNSTEECLYITFSEKEFLSIIKNMNVSNFYKINDSFIVCVKIDYKSRNFFKKKNILMSERNVSYASAISSKARIKLHRSMVRVLKDGGKLLYCDTDSIFAAYPKHNIEKKLEDISWLEFYEDGVFIAPKTYALSGKNDVIKIKGVSIENLKFDEIKKSFYENISINFNNQLNIRKFNFDLKQEYINKNINLNLYDKRIFSVDKKETVPIELFTDI